ncbi:ribonuclease HI [Corynebacterium glucuronolyticum]|uniref:ribonuclease HI n=1 Tax=Corynebacterium glucuronolyticum TaxID=39791 RepID=UPI00019C1CC1|nr:hypothetical protein [Corynebacterium glucuronolyticum]EEI27732.1 ribonuclease HI [Corynebacterium glucuronolyticum ATCC 51867]QRO82136.1 hypothetical protein I6J20_09735 [Corynebacterium glucuronolyticum]
MFIPVAIDYEKAHRADKGVVTLSGGGATSVQVCSANSVKRVAAEMFIQFVINHTADTLGLYTSASAIKQLIAGNPSLFANVHMYSVVQTSVKNDYEAARALRKKTVEKLQPTEERPRQRRDIVVATDASLARGNTRAAIAMISTYGKVQTRIRRVAGINEAELHAVQLAVNLHILTDSRYAFTTFECPPTTAKVHLHWVRGHNGNVLNGLADRAARFTRRNDAWKLPEMQEQMEDRLRDEIREIMKGKTPAEFIPTAGEDTCAA